MSRLQRLALFAYLALVGVGFLSWAQLLVENQIKRFPLCVDFIRYYAFASLAQSPDKHLLYDIATQTIWIDKVVAPARLPQTNFIEYPPQLALFMTPFIHMPVLIAYGVFSLVGLLFCAWTFARLRGGARPVSAILFLLFCASTASFFCNWFGQVSFFYTAAVAIFVWALRKGNVAVAGASLAALTLKFQFLPFLFLAAISNFNNKPLAYAGSFICSLLILLGATGLFVGWDAIASYPTSFANAEFLHAGGTRGLGFESMISLATAVSNTLNIHGHAQQIISIICAAIALVACAIVLYKAKTAATLDRALAITISAALIFAPHSHTYDELLLLVPVALLCKDQMLFMHGQLRMNALSAIVLAYPALTWLIFALLYVPFRDTLFPLAHAALNIAVLIAVVKFPNSALESETPA